MLTWKSDIIDATVSVGYAATNESVRDWSGRTKWSYTITLPGFTLTREDISTPDTATPVDVLRTMSSFLDAWQEAQSYGPKSENFMLFPGGLALAIEKHGAFIDEFSMDMYDRAND